MLKRGDIRQNATLLSGYSAFILPTAFVLAGADGSLVQE